MVAVEAERRERLPLARVRRGEHLRAQVPGDLQRRHADAAGRRVQQQRLAGLEAGEVDQPVVGGEERDRNRGGLDERPALRDLGHDSLVGHGDGAEASGTMPITRSPGARPLTSAPTSVTTPAAS